MSLNLLATKLHRPAPPPRLVQRSHLMQRLDEGLQSGCQITLISAPAGFGKSTCASEWLNSLDLPVSWLSLDASDDDPARFLAYLVAALQKTDEGIGREIEAGLQSGQLSPAEPLIAALLGDIEKMGRKCFLVLDDFQVIKDSTILNMVGVLLAHLPGNLYLVLITREDPQLPLARLRANNNLTEIRAADLRFRQSETGRFLNAMTGLTLSEGDIATLEQRTEGWVVGLQLAGLSMRGRENPSDFIARLSGNHRYILSYLTEEVLSRQPEEIQDFLLQTSILDRLSGDLCDAVTGRADSAALLERLLAANLFLIPLDDEQRWYRYHHLFADLLASRRSVLLGAETAQLHQRASRWFALASEKTTLRERAALAGEAIHHALAAADYSSAVRLMENHVTEIINQWYSKTVTAWIQALPPEWSAQSARLSLAFARMHLIQGDFAKASPYIERLYVLFPPAGADRLSEDLLPEDASVQAGWLALLSTLVSAQGRAVMALGLANQALAIVPAGDDETLCQIYLALAVAYQQMNDWQHTLEAYQKLIQLGQTSDNITTELLGVTALGLMAIQRGQLRYAFDLAEQAAARVSHLDALPPIYTAIYGELGQIYFHWCRLDEAERNFQRAAQMSAAGSFSDGGIFYAVASSRLLQIQGDIDGAVREIQKAVSLMRVDAPVVVREEVIAQQVNVALAQNNLAGAEQILFPGMDADQAKAAFPALVSGQSIAYTQGVLYLSALRILLYRARRKNTAAGQSPSQGLPDGIDFANRLLAALLYSQFIPLALETLLLRAQLHAVRGNQQASLADLTAALDMAEPEGYISVFVMEGAPVAQALQTVLESSQPGSAREVFLKRILAASPAALRMDLAGSTAGADVREPGAAFPESLSAREVDVMRLMAEGQTYEEIAGKLVVSINTVRSHVKSIYGKLGVNNRVAAIEAARARGIL
jgi:LuxR family transcriptional regulator, maltose regulon positive regulatory protein